LTSPECLSEERLAELAEGRLAGDDLARAERHLAVCAECRGLAASMAALVEPKGGDGPESSGEPAVVRRNDKIGRYVVVRELGAGAMGHVYAAYDPALDRTIALKLLRPDVAVPGLESRLLREAKAMARIAHPHVITVHDVGRHGDQVYIAMEIVEGGTLREWLAARPRTWREVLDVYVRAGAGLAEAHAAGIVHRDFKPDNVLVSDDARVVRVTDFGLARVATGDADELAYAATLPANEDSGESLDAHLTRTGVIVGTPVYMAPEQHAGETADARSDVYSFCVALYEGLYGERPFRATTLAAHHAVKLAERVNAPAKGRDVPQRVRRALLAGLRAKPEDRYASMGALLGALERAAHLPRTPFAWGVFALALGVVAWAGFGRGTAARAPGAASASNAAVAPPPECTTNRACVERHGGEPWLCRASDKTCVPLASDDCTPRFERGDLEADDTVWLGAMFPTKGPLAESFGRPSVNAVELARREFSNATRALTGAGASLRVRRIALVTCDDGDADTASRAATHLVDDVAVPAILGFRSGQEVVDLAGSLLVGRGVLAVASSTSSPIVTQVPQPDGMPRMVWRTTFNLDEVAVAAASFVRDGLAPGRAPRTAASRVALVRSDVPAAISFGQTLLKALVFSGRSALGDGADYQEVVIETDSAGTLPQISAVARTAERIVSAAPSFVVVLQGPPTSVAVVAAIESAWPAHTPRPTYVIANDMLEPFAAFIGADVERRRRMVSVVSTSDSAANAHFVIRYNEAHEPHVWRTSNPGSSYDAFYLLAFGVAAVGAEHVTGPAIARAFGRLVPPGRPVEVGPTQVFEALAELARGGRVDLEGTSTALDYDLATGEVPADYALLCAAIDATGRATGESVEAGLVFRSKPRRLEGRMRCP